MQIRIAELSKKSAAALKDALAPDNVDFPDGQSMQMHADAGSLMITVSGGALRHIITTTDEVLEHVQVALDVTQR